MIQSHISRTTESILMSIKVLKRLVENFFTPSGVDFQCVKENIGCISSFLMVG